MVNLLTLNNESVIADLRKQRDALMQAVRLIDQAITSLEAIPGLGVISSEPESSSPPMSTTHSQVATKPIHKGKHSLPESVKDEAIKSIEEMTGDITQPLILKSLLDRFPGSEQVAKEKQWSARIAGVLRMLVEKEYLIKVKNSHANNPSVYRKATEMTDEEKFLANLDTSK